MTIRVQYLVEIEITTLKTNNQDTVDKVNDQVDLVEDFFFSSAIICDDKEECTRPAIAGWMKNLTCECDSLEQAQEVEFKLKQFLSINCKNLIVN